ncbi:DUF1566 domain-containing protein [Aquibaculum sediminis]|uniref:Lcl C-terminal domain-containing protein n=1 Tax=Aquibaculum sediminis TaxID=3231907 RepID=UPI003453BCA2
MIAVLAIALPVFTAQAQEPEPCDSCAGYPAGAYMRSGGPELSGETYRLSCESGLWEDLEISDPCASCNPDPCECGTPSPGDTCGDGSIYAGDTPDGGDPMYTTDADAPSTHTWNDGTTNYQDTAMENCTDDTPGAASSCQTGEANTAFLIGATGEPDYPFAAAEHCDGLSAHGHDDWYLPAQDELNVLYTNKNAGDLDGTFDESGSLPAGYYWSSSEYNYSYARYQRFSDGGQSGFNKTNGLAVRCVRR